nr:MAG TPA: hypothetical protein [Bacteriophage sp.]
MPCKTGLTYSRIKFKLSFSSSSFAGDVPE